MKKDFDLMRGFRRTLILLLVPAILLVILAFFTVRVCGCQPPPPTATYMTINAVQVTANPTQAAQARTASALHSAAIKRANATKTAQATGTQLPR
jgi:hypothetical protein